MNFYKIEYEKMKILNEQLKQKIQKQSELIAHLEAKLNKKEE